MSVRIGTSGWQYRDWRGTFYPHGVPTARWLEAYADRFCTVEANGTFYRLSERHVFEAWASRTPPGFEFAVKASRFLTHVRRLQDPRPVVERFMERVSALGSKLGPVLLQLPPTMPRDLARLEQTLTSFPHGVRVAVELRHESWFVEETSQLLARHGAATCLADRRGTVGPLWKTADWGYVRFHEGRAAPAPRYGAAALQRWAGRLAELFGTEARVYAFFNNDAGACAPRNAEEFARACERAGLRTR